MMDIKKEFKKKKKVIKSVFLTFFYIHTSDSLHSRFIILASHHSNITCTAKLFGEFDFFFKYGE